MQWNDVIATSGLKIEMINSLNNDWMNHVCNAFYFRSDIQFILFLQWKTAF